ncbi:SLC26A/SulP transporter family protein [Methyloceanibacter sp.]|uniref:SLC26A/SulP transporter family protein n=1 Tax=Methyloceanibacter sp. TaxID=1965321 RepID=UPI002D5990BD|nr:SulP family inorganic anion transporter [Methyloceanibacter sp.]HZP09834.1 SulP family inorganic anion transporter [Methyloceanibacter sp.]
MLLTNDERGAKGTLAGIVRSSAADIFAGLVGSVISVAYGLSFAALIFAPPLNTWLAYGIAATFVTMAIGAAVVSARSSLPFAVAGPDPTTVAVTATLVSALMARFAVEGAPDDLLAPVIIIMAMAAALSGVFLLGLGFARAGAAIRYIPYPVIGGFLGATGCLMVSGAVRVITDRAIGLSLLESASLAKLVAASAIAVTLRFALKLRKDSPYVVPGILLAGIAATHVVLALLGIGLAEAQAAGWLFKAPAAIGLTPTWEFADLRAFPWKDIPALSGDLFAVMFVTAISTLLNTTGIEFVTKREADLKRELTTVGLANLVTAALGGYVSTITLNRTTLNYMAGGRGRLSGLTVAAVAALMLAVNPGFLAYVPKFVLGALLLYLGAQLVYEWLIASARRISLLEYASLLAIAVLIIKIGFIAGVLIGVIIGCATFAFSASRVNAVKFSFDGTEYRSTLDRGPEELAVLAKRGRQIQGMSLQSYLFFGSANRLYQQVKALFAREPGTRFLVFDFGLVTGIDSSAIHSFTQIKRVAEEAGARLVLVDLPSEVERAFLARGVITSEVIRSGDLDHALEACENAVIAAHLTKGSGGVTWRDWLSRALGSSKLAEDLATLCQRLEVGKDEIIAAQGDPADSMHFILEGRIGILVNRDDEHPVRVRSLGPHTTIGEMGLITKGLRSATIKAEAPSVLYVLSGETYERIKRENEELAQALLAYVVSVMAERLSFASRVIGVLRR